MRGKLGLLAAVALVLVSGGVVQGQTERVDICHVARGDPARARTISIRQAGVERHLAHGDQLGACLVQGNDRVDICHVPQRNPAHARTISIRQAGVERHLAHGDNLGVCCPCWVRANRLGGIDFEAQELEEALCKAGPAGAVVAARRGSEPIGDSWAAQATDTCVLVDEANGIETTVESLSSEESAACLQVLLESQMWLLNCES